MVKLFGEGNATPLFPNDARAEAIALTHLAPHKMAPRLLFHRMTAEGPCLIYDHINGIAGAAHPDHMGKLLSKLHDIPPPSGIRRIASGSNAVLAQGDQILALCQNADWLRDLRPVLDVAPADLAVFLHGDPVPANTICKDGALYLIDWQCPAVGDPVEDIGIFLSPAMQLVYGTEPLSADQVAAFFRGYAHPDIETRYRAIAPALHWRMAAYCQWRIEQGTHFDSHALESEIAALAQ